MRERPRHRKRQHEQYPAFCSEYPTQLRSSAHRVQSIIHPRQGNLFVCIPMHPAFLCIRLVQQYTLGMELFMKVLEQVLVAMFLIGGVGSAFVIAISFIEDMHELFTKDE